jgi:hypothetical protein
MDDRRRRLMRNCRFWRDRQHDRDARFVFVCRFQCVPIIHSPAFSSLTHLISSPTTRSVSQVRVSAASKAPAKTTDEEASKAMAILNSFVNDIFERIGTSYLYVNFVAGLIWPQC